MRRIYSILMCSGVLIILCIMAKVKAVEQGDVSNFEKKSCIEQNQIYEPLLISLYQKSIYKEVGKDECENIELYFIQPYESMGCEIAFLATSSNKDDKKEEKKEYHYLLYETSFDIKDTQRLIRNKTFDSKEKVSEYSEKIKDERRNWTKKNCYKKNPIYYDMVMQLLSSTFSDWVNDNYNVQTGVEDLYLKEIRPLDKSCSRFMIRLTFTTYEGAHNPPYYKNDVSLEITADPFTSKTLQFIHEK